MRRFLSIFKMDLANLFKNPVLVGYNTVFAALLILVMGFLTSGSYADWRDAYRYYGITMLIYGSGSPRHSLLPSPARFCCRVL